MNRLILIFSTLFLVSCHVQSPQSETTIKIRHVIQNIVNEIAEDNVLNSENVGLLGLKSEQWERFEKLNKYATDEELTVLTNYKNPVVRCYSFQALASRKNIDVFPILIEHLNDTVIFTTLQGCVANTRTPRNYFLDVITPEYLNLDTEKLKSSQRALIDSIIIFDKDLNTSAKFYLLLNLKPNNRYYERIKEIATLEKNPVAILALARFQNKNDIKIISTLFYNDLTEYYAAYSTREFSDSSFYPYLTKIFEREWNKRLYDFPIWRILFQALAKYPNQQTYNLFERTTQTKDDFRYQTLGKYLMIAITKYPNELYEPLKAKLKLDKSHSDEIEKEMNIEK